MDYINLILNNWAQEELRQEETTRSFPVLSENTERRPRIFDHANSTKSEGLILEEKETLNIMNMDRVVWTHDFKKIGVEKQSWKYLSCEETKGKVIRLLP